MLTRTLLFCLLAVPVYAEDPGQLTIDRIFKKNEFSSKGFSARWLPDASGYVRIEKSDLVKVDTKTGEKTVLVPGARFNGLNVQGYEYSDDFGKILIYTNSKRVWRANTRGDYWVLDRTSHELKQIGKDAKPSTLMFATLSPDGKKVAYVWDNDIYVEDLNYGGVTRLTDTGSKNVINGTFDWVYEEELGLRNGIRWSPDSSKIAYWQINTEGVREFPLVDLTAGLYPEVTTFAYPKVGQRNAECRVGWVSAEGGETNWLKIPGDPRNHYIARMEWVPDSEKLIVQQLNRLQNTNRVMFCETQTGKLGPLIDERDEAWVDVHDEMKWLKDKRFTWVSERDGWRHLYLGQFPEGSLKLITAGDFDVINLLEVDEEAGLAYFLASPENPTQRYLYSAKLDGSEVKRVTPTGSEGTHSYNISPDGKWAVHSFSAFDDPGMTELISLPDHATVRELEDNKKLKEKLSKLDLPTTEFFRVNAGDAEIDCWCIKPPKMDESKKYPLLVYVYGEPAGQTVVDRWGGSRHLWHMMMAQKGYVVMSFDNRGAPAPRGRDWRKSVYRQIGIIGPRDQAEAVKAVVKERKYIDPDRVGIWGWSGGGSSTLQAMFKYPDVYSAGVSVAPVPNQRFYDTIYQERYMGLPGDNVEGFYKGSPINSAKGLEGKLLLVHGTGDDNVHYQGTEQLINELIRLDKPFQMMAYPNRTHSIREGTNTTLHLQRLITRFFLDSLPPGPISPEGNMK